MLDIVEFEKAFYLLEKDVEVLEALRNINQTNPLIPFFQLIAGITCLFVGIFWVVHICVFVLPNPPIHDFLNIFFIDLEAAMPGFPLFGITFYALFVYYLLWAVIVGNYRVGMRCLCFNLFPMEAGATTLNSLLANCWILLVCSVPAVQFSASCFPIYARETYVNMLFGTQVQYLRFVSVFWEYNIFVYILVFFNLATLAWLLLCPRDNSKDKANEVAQLFKGREDFAKDLQKNY